MKGLNNNNIMTAKATSPLTGSRNVSWQGRIICDELIKRWMDNYDIDITSDMNDNSHVDLFLCHDTGLKFFFPFNIEASPSTYESLSKYDWYYMSDKWEYNAAMKDIGPGSRVLEVGCGIGEFVQKVNNAGKAYILGIELNESAVKKALDSNRNVAKRNIRDLLNEKEDPYDVICSFQVLEHMSNPHEFIRDCLSILKRGGKLLLSVPNNDSFIRLDHMSLLNCPPHHMTRWNLDSLKSLTRIYPIHLTKYRFEPLATYHMNWYANLQIGRLNFPLMIRKSLSVFTRMILLRIMRITHLRRLITGHTIYTCYEKLE